MEKAWKLGEDLHTEDSLLDGLTFADLILTVHCNCRDITPNAVRKELMEILASRKQDMFYLLEMNMDVIMAEARKGERNEKEDRFARYVRGLQWQDRQSFCQNRVFR